MNKLSHDLPDLCKIPDGFCSVCHQADHLRYPYLGQMDISIRVMKCPTCDREIVLIGIVTASKCLHVTRQTIYNWINSGRCSALRSSSGRVLIYYSSLFWPHEEPYDTTLLYRSRLLR
jgi:hypothetical protein